MIKRNSDEDLNDFFENMVRGLKMGFALTQKELMLQSLKDPEIAEQMNNPVTKRAFNRAQELKNKGDL